MTSSRSARARDHPVSDAGPIVTSPGERTAQHVARRHDLADTDDDRFDDAVGGAITGCSIFIDSTTTTGDPAATG
jgi:hypothetical protein